MDYIRYITLLKPAYRQPSTEDDGDDDYGSETDTARKRRQSHEIEKDLIRQKEKEIEAMLMQQKAELADLKRQRALEEQRVGIACLCGNVGSLTLPYFTVKESVYLCVISKYQKQISK